MAWTAAARTPKLPLVPFERAVLRRAHLRALDFATLDAVEIARVTDGELPKARIAELCSLARFQQLPFVGPAMAGDFVRLGYRSPADLVGADPERMLKRLERLAGRQDPCVEDALRCAVWYAENPDAPADRPWWSWSRERLERGGAGRRRKDSVRAPSAPIRRSAR